MRALVTFHNPNPIHSFVLQVRIPDSQTRMASMQPLYVLGTFKLDEKVRFRDSAADDWEIGVIETMDVYEYTARIRGNGTPLRIHYISMRPDYITKVGTHSSNTSFNPQSGNPIDAWRTYPGEWQVAKVTHRRGDRVHIKFLIGGYEDSWAMDDEQSRLAPLYTHTPRPVSSSSSPLPSSSSSSSSNLPPPMYMRDTFRLNETVRFKITPTDHWRTGVITNMNEIQSMAEVKETVSGLTWNIPMRYDCITKLSSSPSSSSSSSPLSSSSSSSSSSVIFPPPLLPPQVMTSLSSAFWDRLEKGDDVIATFKDFINGDFAVKAKFNSKSTATSFVVTVLREDAPLNRRVAFIKPSNIYLVKRERIHPVTSENLTKLWDYAPPKETEKDNYEYVNEDTISQNLICVICSCVLVDPRMHTSTDMKVCARAFDLACAEKVTTNKCPFRCPVPFNKHTLHKVSLDLMEQLNNLPMKCKHCLKEMTRKETETHDKKCSVICGKCKGPILRVDVRTHPGVCEEEHISCPSASFGAPCEWKGQRKHLQKHLDQKCKFKEALTLLCHMQEKLDTANAEVRELKKRVKGQTIEIDDDDNETEEEEDDEVWEVISPPPPSNRRVKRRRVNAIATDSL